MFEILAISIGSVAGIFVIIFGGRGLVDLRRGWWPRKDPSSREALNDQEGSPLRGLPRPSQEIRFCTAADGVGIAYATVGEGRPLVKAPNWLTHLEFEWSSSVWREHWVELAKDYQFVRFDQRGCGLSDWTAEDQSLSAWVGDLESVVDAAGLDRFALIGLSQGGATAIEYTVRHPEKVSHLVLYGAYSEGWALRGDSSDEHEAMMTLMKQGWGRDNPAFRQVFTSLFMPDATAEQMNWFNELQRVSTSPENAVRVQQATGEVDILDRLPLVTVPTLVLHCRGDARVPFEEGRRIASLLPNAKFVPLESRNHVLLANDPAIPIFLSEIRSFLEQDD